MSAPKGFAHEVKAYAAEQGLGGFGTRGRVSASTIEAFLVAHPERVKALAVEAGTVKPKGRVTPEVIKATAKSLR